MTNPPATNSDTKTIAVIGLPRGGTSVVAAVLDAIGIYMGERSELQAGGAFETEVFMGKHRDLWGNEINRRNSLHKLWGWKNPQGVAMLANIPKGMRNVHCVYVFRDPVAMAEGQINRGNPQPSVSTLDSALREYSELYKAVLASSYPGLLVSYERILSRPAVFIAALAAFLNVSITSDQWVEATSRIRSNGGYVMLPEDWQKND